MGRYGPFPTAAGDGGGCLPLPIVAAEGALAVVDGAIAIAAFVQLARIHRHNWLQGWTRQKVSGFSIFCSPCCGDIAQIPKKNCNDQRISQVLVLSFVVMFAFAILIWVGRGENPIDSSLLKRVYLDVFAVVVLVLGGALACYGALLFSKMSKVRSETVSTEKWKVASLAAVSLICFSSSAILALVTNVPVLLYWYSTDADIIYNAVILFVYYFIVIRQGATLQVYRRGGWVGWVEELTNVNSLRNESFQG
ncbi:hypothetical protein C2845_PM08G25620 [Panicum miliaceum]|uniref:THH1/TOM1/TOM3 domain-containing protein n=1 Tax=Panicum miliaceum TaxID=4540 RepID=A0A3L6QZ51_PANMI|nr:hypothetical protein C2845_PM08G25620 [Panicum miliaceum]